MEKEITEKEQDKEKIEMTSKNGTVHAVFEKGMVADCDKFNIDLVKEIQATIDADEETISKARDMVKKFIVDNVLTNEFYQSHPKLRDLDAELLLKHGYYNGLVYKAAAGGIKTLDELCKLSDEYDDELEKHCGTSSKDGDDIVKAKETLVGDSEFDKKMRKSLSGILDRHVLEIDATNNHFIRNVEKKTSESILALKPYHEKLDKVHENNKKIAHDVGEIIKVNEKGIKTAIPTTITYSNGIGKSNRSYLKGSFGNIRRAYLEQMRTSKHYPHYRPSLFKRFIIGLCNLLLKPLKIRMFFR